MSDLTKEDLRLLTTRLSFILEENHTSNRGFFHRGWSKTEAIIHEIGHHVRMGIDLCSSYMLDPYMYHVLGNNRPLMDRQEIEIIASTLHIFNQYDMIRKNKRKDYILFIGMTAPWQTEQFIRLNGAQIVYGKVMEFHNHNLSIMWKDRILNKLKEYSNLSRKELRERTDKYNLYIDSILEKNHNKPWSRSWSYNGL